MMVQGYLLIAGFHPLTAFLAVTRGIALEFESAPEDDVFDDAIVSALRLTEQQDGLASNRFAEVAVMRHLDREGSTASYYGAFFCALALLRGRLTEDLRLSRDEEATVVALLRRMFERYPPKVSGKDEEKTEPHEQPIPERDPSLN